MILHKGNIDAPCYYLEKSNSFYKSYHTDTAVTSLSFLSKFQSLATTLISVSWRMTNWESAEIYRNKLCTVHWCFLSSHHAEKKKKNLTLKEYWGAWRYTLRYVDNINLMSSVVVLTYDHLTQLSPNSCLLHGEHLFRGQSAWADLFDCLWCVWNL